MSDSNSDVAAGMNLHFLLSKLDELKKDYMALGIFLEVPKEKIDGFEKDFPKDSCRIFIEVLNYWLKNYTGDKVKCLYDAVSHVGSSDLKNKMKIYYKIDENCEDLKKTSPKCQKLKEDQKIENSEKNKSNKDDAIDNLQEQITMKGDRESLTILLRDHSHNIYYKWENGETLLHIACQKGHIDILQALIEVYGCRLNITDEFGNTPCHTACAYGQLEVMSYFCTSSRKLVCSIKNFSGQSWLHLACEAGSIPLIRLITCLSLRMKPTFTKLNLFEDDILLHLFSQNRCIKFENSFQKFFCYDSKGYTPLHIACLKKNLSILKLFLSEIQLTINFNFIQYVPSVLALACQLKHFDFVDYLTQHQTKPTVSISNNRDKYGDEVLILGNMISEAQTENAIFYASRLADQKLFSYLSSKYHSFEFTNEVGETLLHAACASCSIDMFKFVYHHVMEGSFKLDIVNSKDKFGNSCMHVATKWGSLEIVLFLFEKSFSVNDQNNDGDSPLHLSIKCKRKAIFDFLLEKDADVNVTNLYGETPLHLAACNANDIYYAKKLLCHLNFDSLNVKDEYGDTPLFNACRTRSMEMMSLLTSCSKIDVSAINEKKKETVANIACRLRFFNFLQEILLKSKPYPSKLQNYLGQTLIHLACWNDDLEMAKFLACPDNSYNISEDINLLDKINELTPLQFASMKNDISLMSYLLNLPGCYPDTKNKQGDTVLHICCRMNLTEMAHLCAQKCSKLVRNEAGNTPLHVACHERHFNLLEWLIKGFPDKDRLDNYVNRDGNSVLHIVAGQEGTVNILKHMVPSGTWNHNNKNRNGNTPLHLAFQSGILENSIYLLSLQYKEESLYNKHGQSPLCLAIANGNYTFIQSVLQHCINKMTTCCIRNRSPNHFYYPESVEVVEIPWMLYMLYLIEENNALLMRMSYNHEELTDMMRTSYAPEELTDMMRTSYAPEGLTDMVRTSYNPEEFTDIILPSTGNSFNQHTLTKLIDFTYDFTICRPDMVTKQVDSHGNNMLHYLALCNYNEKLQKLAEECLKLVDVVSVNDSQSTPLHYACLKGQEWMIFNLLEKYSDGKYINKKNSRGETPYKLALKSPIVRRKSALLFYLMAHGAIIENEALNSSLYRERYFNSKSSIGIILLGNSSVGKTTLVNTLRMMLTDNREALERVIEPTTGLVISEYLYYKNSHCYRFYDFAGQVEFEATHSVYLENMLASIRNLENPIVFLLLVKATDSLEHNKKQVDRWVTFLRGHVQVNTTSFHLALLCSHDDCFLTNQLKSERLHALKEHFEFCDATPLNKHAITLSLNNTKPDSASVCQLMEYLEDMFISCEPMEESQVAYQLNYHLQEWFKDRPCQIRELIEKIKETRQFVFERGLIICRSDHPLGPLIIPHEKNSIIEHLKELNVQNNILLLMQPEDELDWWIVGKHIQNTLFSKASSLFSPEHFKDSPHHSLITFNTGVVPMQKLQEVFGFLGFDFDVIINYLLCLEFCTEISEETFNIIAKGKHKEEIFYRDKLFFFPGLLRKEKELNLYVTKVGNFYISGWIIENKRSWSPRFLHCLLLHLTYKFAVQKDERYFVRRIHLWKLGLFLCTENQVEVLLEVRSDNNIYIICRAQSKRTLAMYRAEIIAEIRSIQDSMIRHGTGDFSDVNMFVLYPPPQNYDAIHTCNKIPLKELTKLLQKDTDYRSYYISNTEAVTLKDLIIFDPCIYMNDSQMKLLIDNENINVNSLPPEILEIPEFKSLVQLETIPTAKINTILKKYSIFSEFEFDHSN